MGLTVGSYKVSFGGDADHLGEWYHNAASFGTASGVSVYKDGITTVSESLTPYGVLQGTVTDAVTGLSIEGVTVNLYDANGNHMGVRAPTSTDTTSSRISLPAATGCGSTAATMPSSVHHNAATFGTASAVTINPGATTTINEDLTYLYGTLRGTVTDAVTGLPIEGIWVEVYDLSQNYSGYRPRPTRTATTSSRRSPPVVTGSMSAGDADHLEEWHHDAASFGAATTVTVTSKGIITANESLTPYGTLDGTVTDAVTGLPIDGAGVNLYDASGNHLGTAYANINGYYKFEDRAPGSYRVRFEGGNYSLEWYHSVATFGTASAVTVNPGATTTVNEDLAYQYGALSGTVTDAVTGLPIKDIWVEIYDLNYNSVSSDLSDMNGHYEFAELPVGGYKLHFGGDADHLEEWHHDAASFGAAAGVAVTSRGTTTANESLTPYGTLDGTVTDAVTGLPIEWRWGQPLRRER